jgi:hypothetical protein
VGGGAYAGPFLFAPLWNGLGDRGDHEASHGT